MEIHNKDKFSEKIGGILLEKIKVPQGINDTSTNPSVAFIYGYVACIEEMKKVIKRMKD